MEFRFDKISIEKFASKARTVLVNPVGMYKKHFLGIFFAVMFGIGQRVCRCNMMPIIVIITTTPGTTVLNT